MPLDWSCGGLAEGLACYNNAGFFDAHEHWESVWLQLQDPEKQFLQALIQVTAAFHHLQRGNTAGAVSLLRRALQRIEHRPASFGGIAVIPLRNEIADWLRALESHDPALPKLPPQISLLPLEFGSVPKPCNAKT